PYPARPLARLPDRTPLLSERPRLTRPTAPLLLSIRTATPLLSTLSLHDALPISPRPSTSGRSMIAPSNRPISASAITADRRLRVDRKSTRLNSSHVKISYAVFCLKKKNETTAPKEGERPRACRTRHNPPHDLLYE